MIKYIGVASFTLMLSGCAIMDTITGKKEDEYNSKAQALLEDAYKNIPKKREFSNGLVTDDYFVPPYVDDVSYPDWYYKQREFAFKETSLESMMFLLQRDFGIVSKTDTFKSVTDIKGKTFPFKFKGRLGEAVEKLSVLTGLAFNIDGDFITWSEFETDFFRVAVPPSVHSFRIGETDQQNNQGQQQFGGFGQNTEVQKLIQNDSFVETSTGKDNTLDAWASMDTNLKAMIGDVKGAFVTFDRSSSVMMVRAYPKVVKQVKQYVQELENPTMTQVVFDFQFIEHRTSEGVKGKLNLDLVKNNFKVGGSNSQLSASSQLTAALLNDFNPVSIGLNVLSGDWSGSEVIIEALSQTGTTTVLDRPTLTSAHNKAAKLVRGKDESIATSSGGGINQSGAVSSINTSVLSVGTEITVVPTIMDRADRVFVQLDIKQSDLLNIDVFESGASRVQTPTTNKYNSVINFSAKSGETVLIASNSINKSEYRSEDAGWLSIFFGGSRASSEENTETLILVTPRIVRPDYR